MAGTYKPIAGLSPDNYGPTNTVIAIWLCSTTVLLSSIRFAIGRRRLLQFDSDDAAFGVALCFGIAASVLSNASVGAGLGRHQDKLSAHDLDRYFKFFWTGQLMAVLSMAAAKLSIVFMFNRIIPSHQAPKTLKVLIPIVAAYAVIAILLIAFQCQPPNTWVLNLRTCPTHGNVYYATTALNVMTDAILGGWILPSIWALQMQNRTKFMVIALFGSRFIICVVDFVKIHLIRHALQSDDLTWDSLGWAIVDQLVVHLSINQATVPRVHVFLGSLQTGLLMTRITANQTSHSKRSGNNGNGFSNSNSSTFKKAIWSSSNSSKLRSSLANIFTPKRSNTQQKASSISENPLNLHPDQGIELSTSIYAGDQESRASSDRKALVREDWAGNSDLGVSAVAIYSDQRRADHIGIHKTVEVRTEPAGPLQG
jgi:hypothetical protein